MVSESGRTTPNEGTNVQPANQRLDFGLLRDLQRVINLDSKVSNGALQLGMAEQYLDGPQVLCAFVDQRCFGPPHRVRTVNRRIQANRSNPLMNNPGVLPC